MPETPVQKQPAASVRDQWRERIAEQARSGLSIKRFCKDRGVAADFHRNRSSFSREIDRGFHSKSIAVFIGKRSPFSRDSDHLIGSVKTVIAII